MAKNGQKCGFSLMEKYGHTRKVIINIKILNILKLYSGTDVVYENVINWLRFHSGHEIIAPPARHCTKCILSTVVVSFCWLFYDRN